MAEEESELELDRFKKELESLLKTSASDERGLQSKTYCGRFCELVEEQTGRWQVPLPQLQVLQGALCSFVQGAASFPPDCEHVRYTLSSLALSVFELLLFFGKDEFLEHPLKDILDSFQDCYTSLVRHQNVYLLQVRHIIKDGGPWANPVLQAILKESELPQEDVDRYLSSEVSVFFELRVRYLLACERLPEAMALSKRCSQHSVAGRHRYFMQAYLTCLLRTSLYERLYKEMADIDGRDAVDILCSTENEAKDEIVLMLSKGFLSQQLQNGDMYYLWDLVFIWSRLCLRVNPSKQGFLEECKLMILSAINIKAIFPFMKVILAEVGRDGLTFCVELCAQALQTDLKNDPVTKSLIYKTIAYLLPNDLEICRACALLVFFLERTVEAYRTVFLLYTHPDQEYHADISLVGNSVRFEVLQVLKKGLYFDPEFWNLLNIETNCRKLMSDKVAEADLCEIMQKDNWVPSYCMKGHCQCHTDNIDRIINNVEKHTNRNGREQETKQFTSVSNETSSKLPRKKRRRKPEMELVDDLEDFPVRRSFRQLDLEKNHPRTLNSRRQRFLAQQAERNTLKRRGRKPQCLVEELAVQAENGVPRKGKKPGRKPKQSNVLTELSIDEPLSEITIKLSYPDNEVDLPTDVQASLFSFETSQMTESSNDKTKIESQEYLKRPSGSTTSPVDISVESTPCSKELFGDREEVVSQEQELFMVRKFHTYSRAAELEETPVSVPRDNVVTTNPNDSKQESLLQSYELQSEPAETPESDTQVKTIVQIEDTQTRSTNLETSTPVEVTDLPIEALHLEPKPNPELSSAQAADCIHPENTVSVENPANNSVDLPPEITTLNTTDTIPIADSVTQENMADLHENGPPVLTEETRVSDDAPAFGSETEIAAPPKIVPVNMEEKELPPVPEEVSQNIHAAVDSLVPNLMPLDVAGHRFTLKCSLCNKDTKDPNILHHAQWHFRIDKKCMFCYKRYTYGRRPSIHFKRHIQELKKSNDPFRKNKKKFENNKRRLKTRLDIADLNKKKDSLEPKVRLRTRLSKNSHPASTLDERKEKVCRKGRRVRTILARRSETRDENKKTFRMRLASRRAKTMQAKTPVEDHSNAKGNSAHRVNGVVRKRRKVARVQEVTSSNRKVQATLTQENGEPKTENVECAEGSATPDKVETKSQNLPDPDIKHGSKMQGKDDENMTLNTELIKTIRPEDEGDVVAVKRRKTTNSHNECSDNQEHKENTITPEDINAVEHKNGINAKPRVRSVPFQGRRTGTSTEVRCPVEICTFSAKSILVLSHVLSHHQGDKKALVFFFNFGKEKCLFCSRKVFNPEHFFDHVVCHKGELKHPCLHQGCKERFQTRLELNDHMLGHHPLRAMCCFPGCPMLADSVMHLYKHEKTHYRLDAKWEQNPLPKMTDPTGQRAPSKQEDGTEVKPESTNSSVGELNGGTAKQTCPTSAGQDDDGRPLVLNKSSISYSGKNHGLVNGHVQNESSTKASNPVTKPQEPSGSRKPTTKAFIRPPPSAYLDESHISMPKRWKEPQATSKTLGSVSSTATPSTRQRCSRCFVSFSSEEELQTHKDKCTSLFGFDSDDESAS